MSRPAQYIRQLSASYSFLSLGKNIIAYSFPRVDKKKAPCGKSTGLYIRELGLEPRHKVTLADSIVHYNFELHQAYSPQVHEFLVVPLEKDED